MRHYRRTTSCWLISQALCFCLFFQGTGIVEALPVSPETTFLSQADLEAALANPGSSAAAAEVEGKPSGWLESAWSATTDVREDLVSWARSSWSSMLEDVTLQDASPSERIQVASASGFVPVPSRLMSFFMASTSRSQSGPPGPPGMASDLTESKPPVAVAGLMSKDATEGIQLLAGYNLISIPEEPADPASSAVFAGIATDLERVEAYDACDLADPWKLYDPADPAASDLTVADHKIGMWVKSSAPVLLPSGGTLPETTTLQLCEGWNLIGFPADQPRHPEAVLAPIAGKWERLFGYNIFDSVEPWEVYDPAVPAWVNNLQLMYPGRGYWLLASEATTLEIRNQGPPPTVSITSPADLAVITEPTKIIGTVESDLLESWTLTYREFAGGDPVSLVTSTSPVSGGTLATFDPTLLLNGLYELELTATDVQGQQVTESIAVSVEGQMKIGHFTLSFVDLAIPVSGLDIEVSRTYDSRDKQQRDFGVGWRLDIRQGSYVNNREPGDGWQIQTGFLPCDTVLESKSHVTVVRLSDHEVYRFALRLFDGTPTGGGCFATARFDYVDGPLPGTILEIMGNTQVFYENGGNEVIDANSFELYEPQDVKLTTRDGRIFEVNLGDGVTLLEDLNGNRLSITPAGITHSSGKGIAFERDAEGRITRITDPLGRVNAYAYDSAGDLITFTDRAAVVTRLTYDANHRLIDIEDPSGVKPIRNEYDAEGRLIRHIDAFGKAVEFGHDLENRREVVTNRLGATRVLEYDARGNVIREFDAMGKVTTRMFDGRDNLLTETDPLGRTTSFTYSAEDDLISHRDPLDQEIVFTYNSRGQLLTVTDPRGAVTSNLYDARGNLSRFTDAMGNATAFTYDTNGNLTTMINALGGTATFEYDASGNPINETDTLGNATLSIYDATGNRLSDSRTRSLPEGSTETLVTTFSYDDLDRLTSIDAPDGSTTEIDYDLLGRATSQTDQLGRVVRMTYDLMGRLSEATFPDGTSERLLYDDEGHVLTQSDRAGRTTRFVYDAEGRLLTTTFPDGATHARVYDSAGQLTSTTNSRGHTTAFTYDSAGRRTAITNALGQTIHFGYDANGNQTSVTDSDARITTLTYDALNRLTATAFPDGTTMSVGYDALGRRTSNSDQAGITTDFGYDAMGRLIQVTDALEQATSFTYDEVGNRLTQTDANGHTTLFEYDRMGRQIARTLPDGARETLAYNADGTLASHTDFNGAVRTFEYDADRRLIRRAYPDGSAASFTYTLAGQRATATDGRGTTRYTYDSRDRLVEKSDPDGRKLIYTFDAEGNRASLTATVGPESFTASYGYDALNRLVAVTDFTGEVTTLTYDANGNRTNLAHPNGVTTSYTYNALNRLAHLTTSTSGGAVLQSYDYSLGPDGNRIRIEEHDGTVRSYSYDDLNRLLLDRATDENDELIYEQRFSYDPVGNRLFQTFRHAGATATRAADYDPRDRLLSLDATTYSWDANGNLATKTQGGATEYQWDFENRLTAATLDDGTLVENTYDVDGNRVSTAVTEPGGPTEIVEYLVDTAGFLSHVVADIVNGSADTLYARADDQLIGLYRPTSGTSRSYHTDALGSTRVLSSETGTATDRYQYTAFGELIEHTGTSLQPFGFIGEPFDPTAGLYYSRARWLDPALGRFPSADPFTGSPESPPSLHKYTYAYQNPINLTDRSGLFVSAGEALVAAGIGAIVSSLATVVAADALGVKVTRTEIALAGLYGFVLGPVALAFPAVGVGAAGVAVGSSGYVLLRVIQNPNSTAVQLVEAVALVVASIWGARIALKYYNQTLPGSVAAGQQGPRVPNFPIRNLPVPRGIEISATQRGLRGDKIVQIPSLMQSMHRGWPIPAIGGWRSGNRYFIGEGHHRVVAALAFFRETGNARPLFTLLQGLPQGIPPHGTWTVPLATGPPIAIPIAQPVIPVVE